MLEIKDYKTFADRVKPDCLDRAMDLLAAFSFFHGDTFNLYPDNINAQASIEQGLRTLLTPCFVGATLS